MNDATRVIRAGIARAAQGQPFRPGPTFASAFHAAGDPASAAYTYARFHNPTWTDYENAITELERGTATVVFSSGMAAVTAIFGSLLKTGDVLVMPSDAYYTARVVASGFLKTQGIEVRLSPTEGNAQRQHLTGAKMLWLETPTNPGLEVCDIRVLSDAAHAVGALTVVDNTTPSCLGQQPLALGADLSVSSDTKVTTGHSDLLLGHVTVRDTTLAEKLRTWRTQMGAVPGPMEVWLAHRSLATLYVRLERQSTNALSIAKFLASRKDISGVRYPGLPNDPAHSVASRQMQFYGPVVRFDLGTRERAERFLARSKLLIEATSFGGLHSSAERRARWGGDQISEGFIRLSAGCEEAQDLIADLAQSLE
jgi:cystathionine gamma-lyase